MPDIAVEALKPVVLLSDGGPPILLQDLVREFPQEYRTLLERAVDSSIKEFADYFERELGNDPLTRAERAAIKTYFAWQFGLGPKQERKNA